MPFLHAKLLFFCIRYSIINRKQISYKPIYVYRIFNAIYTPEIPPPKKRVPGWIFPMKKSRC